MSTLKVDNIRHNSATSDAITMASDGTCTAKLTSVGGGQLSHRNLIINGAMMVSQRATSSTSSGYRTLDRYKAEGSNTGQTATQSQQNLSSSDTPYTLGFRNYLRIALASAGTANSNAAVEIQQRIEAQNLANSGWNVTSSSSNITLSFWFRPSTNQTFYGYFYSFDGTPQVYTFSFTASGNNTWTKVTKTIPGNSNLTIDNNTGPGLQLKLIAFYGTDYSNNKTLDQWAAYDGGNQLPDMASTWLTTGTPTFDLTGVQLEVGDTATSFEHRSFGEELTLCSRYTQVFHVPSNDSYRASNITATVHGAGNGVYLNVAFTHPMRAAPSVTVDGAFGGNVFTGSWSGTTLSSVTAEYSTDARCTLGFNGVTSASVTGSHTTGLTGHIYTANNGSNDAALIYSAEI